MDLYQDLAIMVVKVLVCIGAITMLASFVLELGSQSIAKRYRLACERLLGHAASLQGKKQRDDYKQFRIAHKILFWVAWAFLLKATFYVMWMFPTTILVFLPTYLYLLALMFMKVLAKAVALEDPADDWTWFYKVLPMFKYKARKYLLFTWIAYSAGIMWIAF